MWGDFELAELGRNSFLAVLQNFFQHVYFLKTLTVQTLLVNAVSSALLAGMSCEGWIAVSKAFLILKLFLSRAVSRLSCTICKQQLLISINLWYIASFLLPFTTSPKSSNLHLEYPLKFGIVLYDLILLWLHSIVFIYCHAFHGQKRKILCIKFNPLIDNPTKWSTPLKPFLGKSLLIRYVCLIIRWSWRWKR